MSNYFLNIKMKSFGINLLYFSWWLLIVFSIGQLINPLYLNPTSNASLIAMRVKLSSVEGSPYTTKQYPPFLRTTYIFSIPFFNSFLKSLVDSKVVPLGGFSKPNHSKFSRLTSVYLEPVP